MLKLTTSCGIALQLFLNTFLMLQFFIRQSRFHIVGSIVLSLETEFTDPSYVSHEHINVSNYIDIDGKDENQLMEIYGHYSYLIDMHIAQIRPENL